MDNSEIHSTPISNTNNNSNPDSNDIYFKNNVQSEPSKAPKSSIVLEPQPTFKTRFKKWIRTVALIVLFFYMPDQIGWALNYDWRVISRDKSAAFTHTVDHELSADELSTARVANSLDHLFNQILNQKNPRIQLQLRDSSEKNKRSLSLSSEDTFTKQKIDEIDQWITDPKIHPINCGIYSLKDLLSLEGMDVELEELSELTLSVDLMNNVIKPGQDKLKTSLFSIHKVLDAYGVNLTAAKLDKTNVLKLPTPFLANFDSEHFVVVTSMDSKNVYFRDLGKSVFLSREDFLKQLTGFVLARDLENQSEIPFEKVSDAMKTFVWGSVWHSRVDELPGFVSKKSLIMTAVIEVVGIVAFGGAGVIAIGASMFANSISQICVQKGACSAQTGMILAMAIRIQSFLL